MRPTIYIPSRLLKLLAPPVTPAGEVLPPISSPVPAGSSRPEVELSPQCKGEVSEAAAA